MVVSSGKATGNTFEQSLNGQPFFVTGNWDINEGTGVPVVSAHICLKALVLRSANRPKR